jgi:autotransporter strand-loop-strand O-heptosyltransferase
MPDGEAAPACSTGRNDAAAGFKPPYMPAVRLPTQEGPRGLRFDFNEGCRVLAPESGPGWRIRLSGLDTCNTLFESSADFTAGLVRSAKRYFVRFRIEAWQGVELVFTHDYDARGRDVLVQLYPYTIGDGIGWLRMPSGSSGVTAAA